jgi:hypothetical protein
LTAVDVVPVEVPISEARLDVIRHELRELGQQGVLGHAAREIPEDIAHADARAMDARLAEPDGRVHADAVQEVHDRIESIGTVAKGQSP